MASSYSKWTHDVFLSFSDEDEDTLQSFVDDLHSALEQNEIATFKSKSELQRMGEEIPYSIFRAIEESRISIVVFSVKYANSRWRLQELGQIMECHRKMGQVVLPVFYDLDQYEVAEQKGGFGIEFEKLIRQSAKKDEASIWRRTLTEASTLCGWDVRHGRYWCNCLYERNYETSSGSPIKNMIDSVLRILDSSSHLVKVDHLVGINFRAQEVIQMLSTLSNEVLIVGICGEEGIGKTTLAKSIYDRIGHYFEYKSFHENVSDVAVGNDLIDLREKILSSISDTAERKRYNTQGGKNIPKEILPCKRALIVFDNVTSLAQLDALIGSQEWSARGSRIIVTGSDESLVQRGAINGIYRMKKMNSEESFQLFSLHAFKQSRPREDFVDLSSDAIEHCRGNPLALKILGASLAGRKREEWESALKKLNKIPYADISSVLKISYDSLSDEEKDIFLYISCFFIGLDKNYVVLNGFGLDVETGLNLLVKRGLVSVDEYNKLQMHHLLQDMGKNILCEKMKPDWMYDIFLSFRGEETRSSFTAHLNSALRNAGIKVFMDDKLERGANISSSLSRVIRESRVSIVVFSTNYGGSRWCLEELERIMECQKTKGQMVLPVFYNVDPTEVRKQTGTFGEAFKQLIRRISATKDKVLSWKRALTETANLSGWDSKNYSSEVKLINNILETIIVTIEDGTHLPIANHPVGVKSRVQDVIPLLNGGPNDVCILGIWGMRGIGKTTLAKAIYNKIGRNFDNRSFLANIREVWDQDKGPISLQEQLVSDILKMRRMRFHNVELGKVIIKEGLRRRRVLVVLDDVNHLDQLNALCGSREWFGKGSRLIITTTDEHLLHVLQVDNVHKLELMEESESIELFSWHAFKKACPDKDFVDLSRNAVTYSGGLPLALEVLGCYLFSRKIPEWESVMEKLKRIPNHKIQEKLKISFDGLSDDTEKEIFLDISCFFIGVDRNYAIQILNDCGFYADIGISVLIQRSLVTVDKKNKLRMHDLLRDMGREIVRQESSKFPEERSRLWFHEDVLDVLRSFSGTKKIEGLALKLPETIKVCLKTKAFKKMRRLRLLQLGHVPLVGDYEYFSGNIRWLYWHGFPLKCIPEDFNIGSVVAADLKYSKLKVFWKEPQSLEKLKFLNLSHSRSFTQTPDFSRLPNLEKLVLKDCPSLSMVHWSIGYLNKLLLVNLKDCISLSNLPRSFYKLKSLETLILSGCSEIDKLEEDIEQMESLTTLMADNTAIRQAPSSLLRLKNINYISLCGREGSAMDVFPGLIWSWTSPMNIPTSSRQASGNMSSLIYLESHNDDFLHLSSIINSHAPNRILWVKCQSEFHVRQDIAKIMDALHAANCAELEKRPNASQFIDMGTSALSNCHNQVQISVSDSLSSNSLWIHMGEHNNGFEERILQGSTSGDKCPNWLTFNSEGSSVLLKMPQVFGSSLKGITIHVTYSYLLANMTSIHLMNVLIINHTKATIQIHKQEALMSPSVEERKAMLSNLDPDDEVQVIVVFERVLAVKKTTVYLIYGESSVDRKIECSSSSHCFDSSEEGNHCKSLTRINSKRCVYKKDQESLKRAKRR